MCLVGHIVSQVMALYYANAAAAGNAASDIVMTSFVIQVLTVFGVFLMTCRWVLASRNAVVTPQVETCAGIITAIDLTEAAGSALPMEQFLLDSQASKNIIYPFLYTILSLAVFGGIMIFLIVYTFNFNWGSG